MCPLKCFTCFTFKNSDDVDDSSDSGDSGDSDNQNKIVDISNSSYNTIEKAPIHIQKSYNFNFKNSTVKKYKVNYGQYFITEISYSEQSIHKKKIVIFDHYGQDTFKIPVKGWLHKCLDCGAITGNSMFYAQDKYKDIDIYIQLCGKCIYIMQNKIKDLPKYIPKYIVIDINKVLDILDKKTLYIC